jgi:hypothetical protein
MLLPPVPTAPVTINLSRFLRMKLAFLPPAGD